MTRNSVILSIGILTFSACSEVNRNSNKSEKKDKVECEIHMIPSEPKFTDFNQENIANALAADSTFDKSGLIKQISMNDTVYWKTDAGRMYIERVAHVLDYKLHQKIMRLDDCNWFISTIRQNNDTSIAPYYSLAFFTDTTLIGAFTMVRDKFYKQYMTQTFVNNTDNPSMAHEFQLSKELALRLFSELK